MWLTMWPTFNPHPHLLSSSPHLHVPSPPSCSTPHTKKCREQIRWCYWVVHIKLHCCSNNYKPLTWESVMASDGDRSVVIGEFDISYLFVGATFEFLVSYSRPTKWSPSPSRSRCSYPRTYPQSEKVKKEDFASTKKKKTNAHGCFYFVMGYYIFVTWVLYC